jgi:ribosomal protein S18 acetylase RimI-like enzyme
MSHGEIRIRPAAPGDAPALAGLIVELGYPVTDAEVSARMRLLLAVGRTPLVAELDGIVGLLTWSVMHVLHRPGPVGRISTLVVAGRVRGRGVGRALVAAAEAEVRAAGCDLIEVTSNMRRADAHAFYERLGYERTSFRFAKPMV